MYYYFNVISNMTSFAGCNRQSTLMWPNPAHSLPLSLGFFLHKQSLTWTVQYCAGRLNDTADRLTDLEYFISNSNVWIPILWEVTRSNSCKSLGGCKFQRHHLNLMADQTAGGSLCHHCLGYIIMTYHYCGVILHIRTVRYNTSRIVGALKIVQWSAVVSSAL